MFSLPTDPDDSIARLYAAGYDLVIRDGHLVVAGVPYLCAAGLRRDGRLVLAVNIVDGVAADASGNHTIWFAGEEPLGANGIALSTRIEPGHSFSVNESTPHQLSFKVGDANYANIYDKVVYYSLLMQRHARTVDASVTTTPGSSFDAIEDGLPFVYADTNTTRAGLTALNNVFRGHTVAIIGVGGTGSYILDQVAKTSVDRIILIDGDTFENHNAFRAPGAAAHNVVRKPPNKATYFADEYSRMHTGIKAEPVTLNAENLHVLHGATFAFLAAADASERPIIAEALRARAIPFIDVGMSFTQGQGGGLTGIAKTKLHMPNETAETQIPANAQDEYHTNIQIADLNALNAQMAVILWKKHLGFYASAEPIEEMTYKLFVNAIRNGAVQ